MPYLSVNEVLRTGKKKADIRFFVPFYLVFVLSCLIIFVASLSFYFIFLGVIGGLVLSFYFSTRYLYTWQIWAFQNVRNVHELKSKAERCGLIPHWESRFFLPSAHERMALQNLDTRFSKPDEVPDESQTLAVHDIYYSKNYNLIQLIWWSFSFIGSAWLSIAMISQKEVEFPTIAYYFCGGFCIMSLLLAIENLIQFRTTQPVISFSEEGIRIKRFVFIKSEVKDLEFINNGKAMQVRFHVTKIPYEVDLNDLEVNSDTLADLAETFVKRWNR